MNNTEETFEYTYSAHQRDEIQKIREKYLPKELSGMDLLRKLDESTTKKGMACAVTVGIFSTLLLGIGMCCSMVWQGMWFVPGIVIGCVGIAGDCVAYPLFNSITRRERQRLAPQILKLSSELMHG